MALSSIAAVSIRQSVTADQLLGRMTASYRFVSYGTIHLHVSDLAKHRHSTPAATSPPRVFDLGVASSPRVAARRNCREEIASKTYSDVYAQDDFYWGTEPNGLCVTVVDEILPLLGEHPSLIDLGCGEGRDLMHFARHGFYATGVDVSLAGLRKARRWA